MEYLKGQPREKREFRKGLLTFKKRSASGGSEVLGHGERGKKVVRTSRRDAASYQAL
jgi:hypothetical protein